MLFWILPPVVAAIMAFLSISVFSRGNIGEAVGWGLLGLIGTAALVFMGVAPIATGISDEKVVTERKVTDITTHSEDGSTIYNYSYVDDSGFGSTDALNDEISGTNGDSYIKRDCGVMPSWAMISDIYSECTETLYLGKADR